MPFSAAHGDYTRNEEPSLDEILNEPIIRLLMGRDGVEVKTLRALLIAAGVHGPTLMSAASTPTCAATRQGGELMRRRRAWLCQIRMRGPCSGRSRSGSGPQTSRSSIGMSYSGFVH